jgi:hypothetical protein
MTTRFATVGVLLTAVALLPVTLWAQKGDLTHEHAATPGAEVGFGVLALTPIGPPPCVQVTVPGGDAIGGPTDPCAYKLHHLEPEEVTIFKDGAVTFQVHGGGHAMAIYEVSKDTTRDEIGQFLCPGMDPSEIPNLLDHRCRPASVGGIGGTNAAAEHVIADGKGDVVIVAAPQPAGTNVHPTNRVWYEPGRLMSAGGQQFLNGGTTVANGQLITYSFLKTGRYLVICMNRSHFLNDWMFGFVNVVGGN